jgi:hypothetical protein
VRGAARVAGTVGAVRGQIGSSVVVFLPGTAHRDDQRPLAATALELDPTLHVACEHAPTCTAQHVAVPLYRRSAARIARRAQGGRLRIIFLNHQRRRAMIMTFIFICKPLLTSPWKLVQLPLFSGISGHRGAWSGLNVGSCDSAKIESETHFQLCRAPALSASSFDNSPTSFTSVVPIRNPRRPRSDARTANSGGACTSAIPSLVRRVELAQSPSGGIRRGRQRAHRDDFWLRSGLGRSVLPRAGGLSTSLVP